MLVDTALHTVLTLVKGKLATCSLVWGLSVGRQEAQFPSPGT